jgi:hypothetical protein
VEEKTFSTIKEERVTSIPPSLTIKRKRRRRKRTKSKREETNSSSIKEKGRGEVTLDHQGGVSSSSPSP